MELPLIQPIADDNEGGVNNEKGEENSEAAGGTGRYYGGRLDNTS